MSHSYDGDTSNGVDSIEIVKSNEGSWAIMVNGVWFGGIHTTWIDQSGTKLAGFIVETLDPMLTTDPLNHTNSWNRDEWHDVYATEFLFNLPDPNCKKCYGKGRDRTKPNDTTRWWDPCDCRKVPGLDEPRTVS